MSTAQRQRNLLVVDDSPEICVIVERLARRAGHALVCCGDVPSAWECLGRMAPDLLILDLNLPGENGLVLCRKVRESPALPGLKIALFSHWDRTGDIVDGLKAGVDYVLSKELLCRPDEWETRLNELLRVDNSRAIGLSLSLKETQGAAGTAAACAEKINQALRQPVFRSLDRDVMWALFARAATRAGGELQEDWLLPNGLGLRPERMPHDQAEKILALAVALKEQIWSVVGTSGSAPFATALAAGIPALAEILMRS